MRRTLAAVLILALLAGHTQMLGALLGRYYAQQQMQHHLEAAERPGDREPELEHMTIPRSELRSAGSSFRWIDEREFRYRGALYDVVREAWRGTVWHVWAVHDQQEEHYLEVLAETAHDRRFESQTLPQRTGPIILQLVAVLPGERGVTSPRRLRARAFPPRRSATPPAPYLEEPHPPPWA